MSTPSALVFRLWNYCNLAVAGRDAKAVETAEWRFGRMFTSLKRGDNETGAHLVEG